MLLSGMVLFARRLMGGGDVKLLAAAGVWAGWPGVWPLLILAAVFGGVLALVVLVSRKLGNRLPFVGLIPWMNAKSAKQQPIPYGVAIGLSALVLFPKHAALPPSLAALFGG